jgi:ABC-2 type transport system permease protein
VIGLLRSEVLRTRSRRVVSSLVVLMGLGILVGVTIGTFHSHPSDPLALANVDDLLSGLALILVLLGVILGSSLGGAEWSTGSVGTLLTWEPRRTRVLLVRALVVGVAVFVMVMAIEVWFVLVFRIGVAVRGTTIGSAGWLGDVAATSARIAAVAALFSLIAYGAAMIGRSSVFGIAMLFGYLVVVEGFLASLWFTLRRWALIRAAVASVSGQANVDFDPGTAGPIVLFTPARGWAVVAGYALVLVLLALLAFRARDVN